MTTQILEKLALGLSGLTASGIGVAILGVPHAFYASYGIALGDNASLLSELRAAAAGLVVFGGVMLMGIWRSTMLPLSRCAALTVFLAFPAGRLIGIVVDGAPSGPIIGALVFELAIATFCLFAFARGSNPARARLFAVRTAVQTRP